MFTSDTYMLLTLASKFLNYTRSPPEMVEKLNKYAAKHKMNTTNINSDTFKSLPVAFFVENSTENTEKFAQFFNILLNFSLRLCAVKVA